MKHSIHSLIAISSILVLLAPACTNQFSEAAKSMKAPRNFTAEMGEEDATKTMLADNGTSVLWQPSDDINAFYGETRIGRYTNNSREAVSVAVFEGDGKSFIGATEEEGTKKNYWAVYPYNFRNTSDGKSVTAPIPDFQVATAGNFAKGSLFTVARSETTVLQFYHVCGGIKFTVTHPGIRQVELKGNNNEVLAGLATVTMDDKDRPVITSMSDPQKTVKLTARDGQTFQVGKWYYLVCAPVVFSQGFTLTLRSATETGVYVYSDPIEVKRAIWGSLSEVDDSVNYSPEVNQIAFPAPKEILYTTINGSVLWPGYYDDDDFFDNLVANEYIDGMGHLLFEPGITSIPERLYDDNTIIKEVIIPEGIEHIGRNAFSRTKALSNIVFPSSILSIGDNAFYGSMITSVDLSECIGITQVSISTFCECLNLIEVKLPETVEVIQSSAFGDCRSLKSISIPDHCQTIGFHAFVSSGIKEVIFPNHPIQIEGRAFSGTRIESVSIPDGSTILEGAFSGCSKLSRFEGELATADGRCLIQNGTLLAFTTLGLTEFIIPAGVTRIGNAAKVAGDSLQAITIPSSVTEISPGSLGEMNNASIIVECVTPPTTNEYGDYLFYFEEGDNSVIYVPAESVEAYKAAPGWSNNANRIQAIPAV